MNREYHKWHSPSLGRDMELLTFGHHGARVIVFPTSMGRFFDWENRGLINVLSRHIENGWLQVFCVDSVDNESWYNYGASPKWRAHRHLQYHSYIIDEVMPFTRSRNDNPFAIATGASFGAYHALNIALRYPEHFGRALGMSGIYDVSKWSDGQYDDAIHQSNPIELVRCMGDAPDHLAKVRNLDLIFPIGRDDSAYWNNAAFSQVLWDKNIWHAFREWDGFAHDWPYWEDMLLHYIGGPETRGY
ncbi:esterase family protein [Candidatus Obscuribacterales bacterium]|nr:esterase family protein [Candidatus Obscuribacterales bacterium]